LYEAKTAQASSSETSYLVELLSTMDEILDNLLTKKGMIGSPVTEYRICEHHNEDGVVKNWDFPVSIRNIFEVRTTRKSIQKHGRSHIRFLQVINIQIVLMHQNEVVVDHSHRLRTSRLNI
jgi:hypothetical protein